jgi:hypothetical protein
MSDQVKNIMLNMYPKRKVPLPSNPEDEEEQPQIFHQPLIQSDNTGVT